MTKAYIELTHGETINLSPKQYDEINYDNNRGYNIYILCVTDETGLVVEQFEFGDYGDREDFINDNGFEIQTVNAEWMYDVDCSITLDHGAWEEEIPCKCDYNVLYTK